jgi:tetratricopeptide (TPR) repeat protein
MRSLYLTVIAITILVSPLSAQDLLQQSDTLFNKAYYNGGSQTHKAALDLALKAVEAGDNSYEAYWRVARGCRSYAEEIKRDNLKNEAVWKPVCVRYGRQGMDYGDKAVQLSPRRVEGWLYYGLSVGNYADGVSMFTAVKEGLVGKTRQSFEKAYALDKTYMWGAPMTALGRMWNILPWPLKDNKKALPYLREAQKLVSDNPEGQVYLALVLLESRDDQDKAEAKTLLQKATQGKIAYFAEWAKRELAKLN